MRVRRPLPPLPCPVVPPPTPPEVSPKSTNECAVSPPVPSWTSFRLRGAKVGGFAAQLLGRWRPAVCPPAAASRCSVRAATALRRCVLAAGNSRTSASSPFPLSSPGCCATSVRLAAMPLALPTHAGCAVADAPKLTFFKSACAPPWPAKSASCVQPSTYSGRAWAHEVRNSPVSHSGLARSDARVPDARVHGKAGCAAREVRRSSSRRVSRRLTPR